MKVVSSPSWKNGRDGAPAGCHRRRRLRRARLRAEARRRGRGRPARRQPQLPPVHAAPLPGGDGSSEYARRRVPVPEGLPPLPQRPLPAGLCDGNRLRRAPADDAHRRRDRLRPRRARDRLDERLLRQPGDRGRDARAEDARGGDAASQPRPLLPRVRGAGAGRGGAAPLADVRRGRRRPDRGRVRGRAQGAPAHRPRSRLPGAPARGIEDRPGRGPGPRARDVRPAAQRLRPPPARAARDRRPHRHARPWRDRGERRALDGRDHLDAHGRLVGRRAAVRPGRQVPGAQPDGSDPGRRAAPDPRPRGRLRDRRRGVGRGRAGGAADGVAAGDAGGSLCRPAARRRRGRALDRGRETVPLRRQGHDGDDRAQRRGRPALAPAPARLPRLGGLADGAPLVRRRLPQPPGGVRPLGLDVPQEGPADPPDPADRPGPGHRRARGRLRGSRARDRRKSP